MRTLIVDKLSDAGIVALRAAGIDPTYEPGLGEAKLVERIGDHEVLVVRGTKVSAQVLEAGKRLQLVVRAGAGTNTIDVAAASRLGIYVSNTPGKNAIAVAELALGLLLGLDRRIPAASQELKGGRWNKKEYSKAQGLFGRTLGIVGVGEIASELIPRAQALGMNILAWSRSLTEARAEALGVARAQSLEALAAESQAVSVHLAYTPETKGLIGTRFFAALLPGTLVVNTSRGGVVDEAALLEAIHGKQIRYAADVFDGEPAGATADFTSPVLAHPSCIGTPHIGASTEQAQDAVAEEAVRVIVSYLERGLVPNCVNLCARPPVKCQLAVRHYDRVGVLAGVLDKLRSAQINVEEVRNVIFEGATAACANLQLGSRPAPELVAQLLGLEHVLGVVVHDQGEERPPPELKTMF